jgi:Galactose oxidase, central domain
LSGTTLLGDTWNFSGGHWTNLTASVGAGPSPRDAAAFAYSAKDGELVLFGGEAVPGYVSDTWTFSGASWTKISTYAHPSSRGAAMAADGPASGTVILFGGALATGQANDTWTFHGLVWSHSLPPTPAPRAIGSMTYDEADGYVLLFGGAEPAPNGAVTDSSDTWKFVQGSWTELHPSSAPSPRYAAGMTYDPADGYVVLFGGTNATGAYFNDTWSFLAGVWTRIGTSGGPPGRVDPAMTYDAADGYVVMFGGLGAMGDLNDTWAYAGGVWWDPVTSLASPELRVGAAMAFDSEDGYVVLYGGRGSVGNVPLFSTWTYLAGVWTNITLTASTGPGDPVFGAMVDDTYDGYLLYVGGCDTTNICNATVVSGQTWSFVSGTWTQLFPARSPGPIDYAAIAFAPPANAVVLFGGQNGVDDLATTWTY